MDASGRQTDANGRLQGLFGRQTGGHGRQIVEMDAKGGRRHPPIPPQQMPRWGEARHLLKI